MRTTVNLDDDVLALAKGMAEARQISVGQALSILARRGAGMELTFTLKNGIPVFDVPPGMPSFDLSDVKAWEAELDRAEAEKGLGGK